jgi:hypothetical protein
MKGEFPGRPQTEVYLNPHGNIVIKQTDGLDESFVWFEPSQIDSLIQMLQDAKREREEDWQPEENDQEEDPGH